MPKEAPSAARSGFTLGYMGYRITAGRLMRDAGLHMSGGLPILCDAGVNEDSFDLKRFARDTFAELELKKAVGLVADFARDTPRTREIIAELSRITSRRGVPLYAPEALADAAEGICAILPSALIEGSLKERLQTAAAKISGGIALEIIPTRMDYTLPVERHEGKRLTEAELTALINDLQPMSFFSTELCTKYFTYIASDRSAHFVLYDDASTIVQKLRLADACGAKASFLLYAEVAGMLENIRKALEMG